MYRAFLDRVNCLDPEPSLQPPFLLQFSLGCRALRAVCTKQPQPSFGSIRRLYYPFDRSSEPFLFCSIDLSVHSSTACMKCQDSRHQLIIPRRRQPPLPPHSPYPLECPRRLLHLHQRLWRPSFSSASASTWLLSVCLPSGRLASSSSLRRWPSWASSLPVDSVPLAHSCASSFSSVLPRLPHPRFLPRPLCQNVHRCSRHLPLSFS